MTRHRRSGRHRRPSPGAYYRDPAYQADMWPRDPWRSGCPTAASYSSLAKPPHYGRPGGPATPMSSITERLSVSVAGSQSDDLGAKRLAVQLSRLQVLLAVLTFLCNTVFGVVALCLAGQCMGRHIAEAVYCGRQNC